MWRVVCAKLSSTQHNRKLPFLFLVSVSLSTWLCVCVCDQTGLFIWLLAFLSASYRLIHSVQIQYGGLFISKHWNAIFERWRCEEFTFVKCVQAKTNNDKRATRYCWSKEQNYWKSHRLQMLHSNCETQNRLLFDHATLDFHWKVATTKCV